MGYAAIAFGREEEHLLVPIIRAQGPAMRERNDRAGLGTPVLVVDFCAISGCEGGHDWDLNEEGEDSLAQQSIKKSMIQ